MKLPSFANGREGAGGGGVGGGVGVGMVLARLLLQPRNEWKAQVGRLLLWSCTVCSKARDNSKQLRRVSVQPVTS